MHATFVWIVRPGGPRREQALTGHDFLSRFLHRLLPPLYDLPALPASPPRPATSVIAAAP